MPASSEGASVGEICPDSSGRLNLNRVQSIFPSIGPPICPVCQVPNEFKTLAMVMTRFLVVSASWSGPGSRSGGRGLKSRAFYCASDSMLPFFPEHHGIHFVKIWQGLKGKNIGSHYAKLILVKSHKELMNLLGFLIFAKVEIL